MASAALSSASCTAQPVASFTWTMRRCEWPPSRVRWRSPLSRLKGTPSSHSRSIEAGAWAITYSTTSRSLSPAPAIMVSRTWFSKVSPASSTAAIPPCAQAVAPSLRPPLASTSTRLVSASASAAVSPAAPEPITRTS